MNIFDFAIQMEDDGYAYYKELASTAKLPGLKTIFTSLADDELKHAGILRALKLAEASVSMPVSTALDTAQNIFKLLPRGPEGLKNVTDSLAAYQHAMKLEADSCRFYEDSANKEVDAEIKDVLLQLAREEQEHFNILENLYHFVNAPNQSLEWGEFSNLGEFHQFGRDTDA